MAGHGTNWFTASNGAIAGSIFCSSETIAGAGFVTDTGSPDKVGAQQAMDAYTQDVQQTITQAQESMQTAGLSAAQIAALTPAILLPKPPPGVEMMLHQAAAPAGAAQPGLPPAPPAGFTAQPGDMFTLDSDQQTIALHNGTFSQPFRKEMNQLGATWYPHHPAGGVWTFPAQQQDEVAALYEQFYGSQPTYVAPPLPPPPAPSGPIPVPDTGEPPIISETQPPLVTAGSLGIYPVTLDYGKHAQVPGFLVQDSETQEQFGSYLDQQSATEALHQAASVTPVAAQELAQNAGVDQSGAYLLMLAVKQGQIKPYHVHEVLTIAKAAFVHQQVHEHLPGVGSMGHALSIGSLAALHQSANSADQSLIPALPVGDLFVKAAHGQTLTAEEEQQVFAYAGVQDAAEVQQRWQQAQAILAQQDPWVKVVMTPDIAVSKQGTQWVVTLPDTPPQTFPTKKAALAHTTEQASTTFATLQAERHALEAPLAKLPKALLTSLTTPPTPSLPAVLESYPAQAVTDVAWQTPNEFPWSDETVSGVAATGWQVGSFTVHPFTKEGMTAQPFALSKNGIVQQLYHEEEQALQAMVDAYAQEQADPPAAAMHPKLQRAEAALQEKITQEQAAHEDLVAAEQALAVAQTAQPQEIQNFTYYQKNGKPKTIPVAYELGGQVAHKVQNGWAISTPDGKQWDAFTSKLYADPETTAKNRLISRNQNKAEHHQKLAANVHTTAKHELEAAQQKVATIKQELGIASDGTAAPSPISEMTPQDAFAAAKNAGFTWSAATALHDAVASNTITPTQVPATIQAAQVILEQHPELPPNMVPMQQAIAQVSAAQEPAAPPPQTAEELYQQMYATVLNDMLPSGQESAVLYDAHGIQVSVVYPHVNTHEKSSITLTLPSLGTQTFSGGPIETLMKQASTTVFPAPVEGTVTVVNAVGMAAQVTGATQVGTLIVAPSPWAEGAAVIADTTQNHLVIGSASNLAQGVAMAQAWQGAAPSSSKPASPAPAVTSASPSPATESAPTSGTVGMHCPACGQFAGPDHVCKASGKTTLINDDGTAALYTTTTGALVGTFPSQAHALAATAPQIMVLPAENDTYQLIETTSDVVLAAYDTLEAAQEGMSLAKDPANTNMVMMWLKDPDPAFNPHPTLAQPASASHPTPPPATSATSATAQAAQMVQDQAALVAQAEQALAAAQQAQQDAQDAQPQELHDFTYKLKNGKDKTVASAQHLGDLVVHKVQGGWSVTAAATGIQQEKWSTEAEALEELGYLHSWQAKLAVTSAQQKLEQAQQALKDAEELSAFYAQASEKVGPPYDGCPPATYTALIEAQAKAMQAQQHASGFSSDAATQAQQQAQKLLAAYQKQQAIATGTLTYATSLAPVLDYAKPMIPSGFGQSPEAIAFALQQTEELATTSAYDNGKIKPHAPSAQQFAAAFQQASPITLTDGTPLYQAVKGYQDGTYQQINIALWNAQHTGQTAYAVHAKTQAVMDALKQGHAPFDTVITRSNSHSHPLYRQMQDIQVGQVWHEQSFGSSKIDPENTWNGADVRVDYLVPQGMHGAYLNGVPGYTSTFPGEVEWVIPANSRWMVLAKEQDDQGNIRVAMGLIAHHDFDGTLLTNGPYAADPEAEALSMQWQKSLLTAQVNPSTANQQAYAQAKAQLTAGLPAHLPPDLKDYQAKLDALKAEQQAAAKQQLQQQIDQPPPVLTFPKNVPLDGITLNGIALTPPPPQDYASIPDKAFPEPPAPPNTVRSGVIVVEDDGRVWVQQDTSSVQHGFSKGMQATGLSAQQAAIKQAQEKLGLQVELTSHLGDYAASNGQVTRFYVARRTGGSPEAASSQMQVSLVAQDSLTQQLANASKTDKAALEAVQKHLIQAAARPPKPPQMAPPAAAAAPASADTSPALTGESVTFAASSAPPPGDLVLHGIPLSSAPPLDWASIPDVPVAEPPLPPLAPGMQQSTGVVVVEPDGRLWVYEPTNHFGGYEHTFSKGRLESGLTAQQNACKEAYEELGLQVQITGYLTDAAGTTSQTRYYLAKRTGGAPWDAQEEAQAVKLVSPEQAAKLLNMKRDQQVLAALQQASPAPVPGSAPTSGTSAAPASFPPVSSLSYLQNLGGSTGAKLYADQAGQRYVVKPGAHAAHIQSEVTADRIYQALDVATPACAIQTNQGQLLKMAQFIPDAKPLHTLSGAAQAAAQQQLQQHFATDALLGNWDVVGLGADNVLVGKDGTVWRVDNGGALAYRAQGTPKSAQEWQGVPTELWSMRDAHKNSSAAAAFSGMSWSQISDQMRTLVSNQETILAHAGDQHAKLQQRLQHMATLVDATDALQGTLSDSKIERYLKQWTTAQATGKTAPKPPFDAQEWWKQQVAKLMAQGKSEEEAQAMVAGLAQKLGFSVGG